ncbi:MAG: hypothetical protein H6739_33840 [Alphaproteobacteria bacterium]|nr:hypothetical protein [Alphaproteobacteria bacterium]
MPNPTAPPPSRGGSGPENLDQLVFDALRKGSTRELEAALKSAPEGPTAASPSPTPAAPPSPAPPALHSPTPPALHSPTPPALHSPTPPEPVAAPEVEAPPPPPADPVPALDALGAALAEARRCWDRGDPRGAHVALEAARGALDAAGEAVALAPQPPLLVLPPIRRPVALVVDGPGDAERAAALAAALGVDIATARMIAVSPHLKVALRADDAEALREPCDNVRQQTGLGASVVARDTLLAQPTPRLALALGEDVWTLTTAPSWEPEPELRAALRPEAAAPLDVRMAVVGEVVVRRYRQAGGGGGRLGRKKDTRLEAGGERRVGVVDLHGPVGCVRVVEGITELKHVDAASEKLRFRAFVDSLAERFPEARIEPRRMCRPSHSPVTPEGFETGQSLESSGWPTFEEHTRLARVHGLAPRSASS